MKFVDDNKKIKIFEEFERFPVEPEAGNWPGGSWEYVRRGMRGGCICLDSHGVDFHS